MRSIHDPCLIPVATKRFHHDVEILIWNHTDTPRCTALRLSTTTGVLSARVPLLSAREQGSGWNGSGGI